jgi:hypothetical protein
MSTANKNSTGANGGVDARIASGCLWLGHPNDILFAQHGFLQLPCGNLPVLQGRLDVLLDRQTQPMAPLVGRHLVERTFQGCIRKLESLPLQQVKTRDHNR